MRRDEGIRDVASAGCEQVRSTLRAFLTEELPDRVASPIRSHLSGCAACRSAALQIDPSILFLALREEPLPDGFWTGFQTRLRVRIEAESAAAARERWRAWVRYPRLAWVAPAVMAAVLGVTLYVAGPGARWRSPRLRATGPSETLPNPYAAPVTPGFQPGGGAREPGAGQAAAHLATRGPTVPGAGGLPTSPAMEGVASPGARVYRFEVGEAGDETLVYLVVDESIDI